jgi:multidrug efflux pump subunit AcrA (membrane-fusion protein)
VTLSQAAIDENNTLLIPGMGADVFIRTGARTPLDYLLSPIVNSLQFALREN